MEFLGESRIIKVGALGGENKVCLIVVSGVLCVHEQIPGSLLLTYRIKRVGVGYRMIRSCSKDGCSQN